MAPMKTLEERAQDVNQYRSNWKTINPLEDADVDNDQEEHSDEEGNMIRVKQVDDNTEKKLDEMADNDPDKAADKDSNEPPVTKPTPNPMQNLAQTTSS
jgi:hypothetical protein